MTIELRSQFSFDLVHEVLAGALDLAIVTEPQDSPLLSKVQIGESPFYIAVAKRDDLAALLLMARNGVTVRPLAETELRMKTYLASRADNESKVASELLRAFMRKLSDVNKYKQLPLPISV
jgi:hypothetical protein